MNATWLCEVFGRQSSLLRLAGLTLVLAWLALAGEPQLSSAAALSLTRLTATQATGASTLPATITLCPLTIGFGEAIQCSIDEAAETDIYTFVANAGDRVLVRMINTSGTLWPGIVVYRDGPKLCTASDRTTAEIASCLLFTGGTYTTLAYDGFNTTLTGSYSLYLQRLNNPGNALPIQRGQSLSGSIASPAQMDTYTFVANAGDRVPIRMSRVSGTLWPGLRVYDPDGTKLCEASNPMTAEIASCLLSNGGTYTILAYDEFNGTLTGSYNLYLECCNVYLPLISSAR